MGRAGGEKRLGLPGGGPSWVPPEASIILIFITTVGAFLVTLGYVDVAVLGVLGVCIALCVYGFATGLFRALTWLFGHHSKKFGHVFRGLLWTWMTVVLAVGCILWAQDHWIRAGDGIVQAVSNQSSAFEVVRDHPQLASGIPIPGHALDVGKTNCTRDNESIGVLEEVVVENGQAVEIVSMCWTGLGTPPCFEEITFPKYRRLPLISAVDFPNETQQLIDGRSKAYMATSLAMVAHTSGRAYLPLLTLARNLALTPVSGGQASVFSPAELEELDDCIARLRN